MAFEGRASGFAQVFATAWLLPHARDCWPLQCVQENGGQYVRTSGWYLSCLVLYLSGVCSHVRRA